MTFKSIDEVVTMLAEAFGQKVTPIRLMAYDAGLSDLPLRSVADAVTRAIRECQFMPSVFELRQLAGAGSGQIAAKDKPTLAWCDVRRAISRVGGYESPNFDDPIINATIREMGGWVLLCDSTVDELVWREKDFLRMYAALSSCRLPGERTERLAGIVEIENGSALPAPVVDVGCLTTGTSGAVRRIEAETETKRLPAPSPAADALAKRLEFDDRDDTLAASVVVRSREEQLAALSAMKGTA